jgi:aminopeptidase N
VNSSGRPVFYEEIEYNEKGNVTKFIIHQKAEDESEKVWTQSFKIQLKDARGYVKNINIKNMGKSFDITSATKDFKPGEVLYNTNGFGYGVFPIYKNEINSYKDIKDEVSRGYQFINLYENMLIGTVTSKEVYEVFFIAMKEEKNELIFNYITKKLHDVFWTFLTEEQRSIVLPKTVQTLVEIMYGEHPQNIKKMAYNLFVQIGSSKNSVKTLYSLWNKDFQIKNLFLNEDDFTNLAMKLAIFEHPKASEILATQQTRILNNDRIERFIWLLPSLSSDENVRDKFMISLLQKENREKESWVQTALNNIHHPLRHASSAKHLKSILEKLEEVKLTGDIFFPKNWLASSIGNYSSKEAAEIVTDFLDDNSDYNPILVKKLLQTTDDLMRAQKIKK